MGRNNKKAGAKKKQKKKSNNNGDKNATAAPTGAADWLWVDPERVRFQHSRIRPVFSGCGRSVTETLESIRRGQLSPSDLPPIQVIVGPFDESDNNNNPWYFSLNNRRLWVLKRCRQEGLLLPNDNKIRVRVRAPKSRAEAARYSLENCALEAKLIMRKAPQQQEEQAGSGVAAAREKTTIIEQGGNNDDHHDGEKPISDDDDDHPSDADDSDHNNPTWSPSSASPQDDDDDDSSEAANDDDDDKSSSSDDDDDNEPITAVVVGNRFSALLL